MDKQSVNIPINTRIVGDSKHIFEGIYVLYLEDYVHTFIKKLLYEQEYDEMVGVSICMYGSSFEKEAQTVMVVSGAVLEQEAQEKHFLQDTQLCTASVKLNKDRGIRFELSMKGTKVMLDDFYIYYDQNDEMQNYLIAWNSKRYEQQPAKTARRVPTDNAARLGRLAQAYNKESARVSLVWGAMNVLSLSLVVCVIAYGIISLNSYGKMQSMQESIDYCMTFVSETIEKNNQSDAVKQEAVIEVAAKAQPQETSVEIFTQQPAEPSDVQPVETVDAQPVETPAPQPTTQIAEPETVQPIQSINTSVPQYYVVQRGDTLGKICQNFYGNYAKIEEICTLNNLENPDNILYGQRLLLPQK